MLDCFSDITDLKKSEQVLHDKETAFERISDAAQDAILIINSEGLITFWNRAAAKILGWTAEEMLGQGDAPDYCS